MSSLTVNRKSAAACIFLALSGCASPGPACPPVVAYTPAEQQQAAAELRAPPAKPMLGRMVADYGTMRDRVRSVCK
jgi:hypothetical protein